MARFENVSFSVTVLCGLEQNATADATAFVSVRGLHVKTILSKCV